MKAFEFRLGTVLRYRETQLKLERARLSGLLADEAALRNRQAEVVKARHDAVLELQQTKQFESTELRSLSAYLLGVTGQERSLQDQIARRAPAIAAQRDRVLVAERNVKLLEKLKTRRFAEWQQQYDREIAAAAEEAWSAANFTKNRPGDAIL